MVFILHLGCFGPESAFLFVCVCAGHVNVAPCHLTAEAETLLSATLIHEVCLVFVDRSDEIGNMAGNFVALLIVFDTFQVMHVLGFDPHAFAHFRDERKRRRIKVFAACVV